MASSFQTSPPGLLYNASHPPGTPGQSPTMGSVGGTTLTYSLTEGDAPQQNFPAGRARAAEARTSARHKRNPGISKSSSYPDTNPKSGVRLGGSENLVEESEKELESK